MTAQPLFDTARFRDRLTSSGMPEGQARAVTEGFDEALRGATATKADVEKQADRLDSKIDALEAKLGSVEARLDAKIDGVEERLGARISLLEEKIARGFLDARAETGAAMIAQLRWIVASLFGGLGLLFAALKFFP